MIAKVNMNSDRSEIVRYDSADFPAYIRKSLLSYYPDYAAESHWHDDLEFILILDGEMKYNVNGEILTLRKNEGIFVNARQFHFGFSETHTECLFICILLHPVILCSSHLIEEKFITPVTKNTNMPYLHLKKDNPMHKEILDCIEKMQKCSEEDYSELKIQNLFNTVWLQLFDLNCTNKNNKTDKNHHLSVFRNMVSFIHMNYKEKITLSDIAASGGIGKTSCCTIFKQFVSRAPNDYLTYYRLGKSTELLTKTDMTVTQIGYEVGFSGSSYFAEAFKKHYGCTPSDFRRKQKNP